MTIEIGEQISPFIKRFQEDVKTEDLAIPRPQLPRTDMGPDD